METFKSRRIAIGGDVLGKNCSLMAISLVELNLLEMCEVELIFDQVVAMS